jgi:hypothetical protein
VLQILDLYAGIYQQLLAVPVCQVRAQPGLRTSPLAAVPCPACRGAPVTLGVNAKMAWRLADCHVWRCYVCVSLQRHCWQHDSARHGSFTHHVNLYCTFAAGQEEREGEVCGRRLHHHCGGLHPVDRARHPGDGDIGFVIFM